VHPGNPWDLKGYWQKSGESLCDYIRRFSRKCHELPSVADTDVILVFWDSTTYCTLVHEIGREQPKTTKELLDMQLAKRRSGPPSSLVTQEWLPTMAGPHPPRPPSKAPGKALRVERRDRSVDPVALP
jgi:hypothetical protein